MENVCKTTIFQKFTTDLKKDGRGNSWIALHTYRGLETAPTMYCYRGLETAPTM